MEEFTFGNPAVEPVDEGNDDWWSMVDAVFLFNWLSQPQEIQSLVLICKKTHWRDEFDTAAAIFMSGPVKYFWWIDPQII